jgi:hypothetical protein
MPNISLMTLGGIPDIGIANAMTQNNANACGAYAVIGAVGAFEIFPDDFNLAYENAGPEFVNNNAQILGTDNFHQLSAAAYIVTGILNIPGMVVPVVPELHTDGNVYNSPAAMAKVAMDLGRPAPQINVQAAGFAELNALYPEEEQRCIHVVGVGNVNTNAPGYLQPAANETHLICVNVNLGGLHWIAQGSDGLFYDPADGLTNHNSSLVYPINTGTPIGAAYTFSGLWMVIC